MLNKSMRGLSLSLALAMAASADAKGIAVTTSEDLINPVDTECELPEYGEPSIEHEPFHTHKEKRIRYAQFSPAKRLLEKQRLSNLNKIKGK